MHTSSPAVPSSRTTEPSASDRRVLQHGHIALVAVLASWGAAVAVAAQTGLLKMIYPPLIAPIVGVGIVAPTLAYFMSAHVRGYIEAIGLRPLTLMHIWRIPAALLFFWYGAQGLLPETFVRHAAWGDLIAGMIALTLLFVRPSRGAYWFMHLFGVADFLLAVGTGLTLTLMNDPRMSPIRELPLALIPLFGVGISGATHIMAFDLLRRGKGTSN
jgi:hypothetical protein